jgi:hypothetical protein
MRSAAAWLRCATSHAGSRELTPPLCARAPGIVCRTARGSRELTALPWARALPSAQRHRERRRGAADAAGARPDRVRELLARCSSAHSAIAGRAPGIHCTGQGTVGSQHIWMHLGFACQGRWARPRPGRDRTGILPPPVIAKRARAAVGRLPGRHSSVRYPGPRRCTVPTWTCPDRSILARCWTPWTSRGTGSPPWRASRWGSRNRYMAA